MALEATNKLNVALEATNKALLEVTNKLNVLLKASPALPLKAALIALMATATLAACGTRANDPVLGVVRGLSQDIRNRNAEPAPTIDPRQVLTRAIINTAATPLILVDVPTNDATATLQRIAINGDNETWQIGDDTNITLTRNGLLRQTRGLDFDLYATDITATQAALRARAPGPFQRVYVHVNGALDSVRTPVTCDLRYGALTPITIFGETRSLTPVTEVCTFAPTGNAFTNQYTIDQSGLIWTSQQWTSPEIGHINIERLYR